MEITSIYRLFLAWVLRCKYCKLNSPLQISTTNTPSGAAIKSVVEPEVDPIHNLTRQDANQDICEVKTSYLTHREGFDHETNFHGFYTH